MPKAKKPAPFMIFVKEKYPKLPLNIAINKAAKEWEVMPQEQKNKYKDKSKSDDIPTFNAKPREKLSTQGIPVSFLEKEKRELQSKNRSINSEIEDIVDSARTAGNLEDVKFNFVSVNYFSRNTEGTTFTPAEIAFSIYSLKDGVINQYHSLINPNTVPFGQAFETKQHSDTTHQLGVPPNVEGEKDLPKLYLDCIEFVRGRNKCASNFPPVFTHQNEVKIVECVLDYLKTSAGLDDNDDDYPSLRVYPMHYLFYVLKKATSEIGETKSPESIHITNAYLDKDVYEHHVGISCNIHEKLDCSKYCALSCVIRWAYTFSDHLCKDLALKMEPGHHLPSNVDMASCEMYSEFDSTCATGSKTEPKKTYYAASSLIDNHSSDGDFGAGMSNADSEMSIDSIRDYKMDNDANPWTRRNKTCREPSDDSFSICSENFPAMSSRGRGLKFKSGNAKPKFSSGRGLSFN